MLLGLHPGFLKQNLATRGWWSIRTQDAQILFWLNKLRRIGLCQFNEGYGQGKAAKLGAVFENCLQTWKLAGLSWVRKSKEFGANEPADIWGPKLSHKDFMEAPKLRSKE